MNQRMNSTMMETRKIGKRLLSAALAVAMAVTTTGTQVFASPEESGAQPATDTASQVLSWSWPEGSDVIWDEETQAWLLSCTYSEDQPLTQETLTQLLPAQVTAVVQTGVATSETAEEETSQPTATPNATATPQPSQTPAADDGMDAPGLTESATNESAAAADGNERQPQRKSAPTVATDEDAAKPATAEPQSLALNLTWDFSGLTFPLQTGEYTLTASLPETYQLAEGTTAVQLKLQVMPPIAMMANGIAPLAYGFVNDTVSPVGTTINLFDYWLQEQGSPDNGNPKDVTSIGINKGHTLWFWNTDSKLSDHNHWTGNASTYPNIVDNVLQNGYPQLQVGEKESLSYLFDTNSGDYKKAYSNVKGLLRVDDENYYYYDSKKNYAQYDESTNSFQVLNTIGIQPVGASGSEGQFFPFNKVNADGQVERLVSDETGNKEIGALNKIKSSEEGLDHYFGMSMTTRFVQMEGGTNNEKPVTYEFSGDDDVWVFIDDVLVGDLGGIHDAAKLKIDFQTGKIFINDEQVQGRETLKQCFEKAGKVGNGNLWSGNTFADNTYHTLKFFYLERGNNDSNMSLKFNLVSIPQSDLIKVDQTGDPVPGAKFALYAATDENYSYNKDNPIATGTTESDGSFVFLNEEDKTVLRLNDLKVKYPLKKFVLKEISVPSGYRSAGEIQLYFDPAIENQAILLSYNKWDTGAYAMPMVTATLPNGDIKEFNGTRQYQPGDGLYFAVVLKKGDATKQDTSDWYPVSGDPIEGWTVSTNNDMAAVLQAATNNAYTFQTDSSGAYSATIQNLPGDIKKYKYIQDKNEGLASTVGDAEYTIAYYHTTKTTLAEATPDNTVRVDPGTFTREFAVRLYVPNIKNMLVVQKVDDNDEPLTNALGAEFELYTSSQVTIDPTTGEITVNENETPYDTAVTRKLSRENNDDIDLDSAAVFPSAGKSLTSGTYYLREKSAPDGYIASTDWTEIYVDETGVYADAGDVDDDVTVLRGAGNLVRSMIQFAVPDNIDTTLTDITAKLLISDNPADGEWKDSGKPPINLSYDAQSTHILDYAVTNDPNALPYFEVESGWSKLQITQNYEGPAEKSTKTELEDGQELTNLFSRSTIVRVRNSRVGLTISKSVDSPVESDKTKTYQVKVTLSGMGVNEAGLTYIDVDGTTKEFTNNSTVDLKNGESITIQGIPAGATYTLEEQNVQNYNVTHKVDNDTPVPGATATGSLDSQNESVHVAFTNTRKTGSVSISKEVTGDLGDKTLPFDFTLELKEGTTALAGTFTVTGSGDSSGTQNITFGADGKAECKLKHGQDITISGLPVGATLTVTEASVTGYTTKINGEDGASDTVNVSETQETLAFVNNCNMQVPTGLHGETRPYAAMVGLAGAAALLSIAGWVELRRRKRREQE